LFRSPAVRSLGLLLFFALLLSFTPRPGGDSFEVYLNNKLLLQEHLYGKYEVKTVQLPVSASEDVLKVHYNHCGKIGTARNLSVRDSQNKTLVEWGFPNAVSDAKPHMILKVKELIALQKENRSARFNLVYSSKEIPEGKVLAGIIITNDNKASLK
jgi:hypothetical protein